MNGFLVGNPGDVEKQKLFVESLGDFVVTKHLPLKHRRSDATADSDGDRASDEVEDCATARVHSAPPTHARVGCQVQPPVVRYGGDSTQTKASLPAAASASTRSCSASPSPL